MYVKICNEQGGHEFNDRREGYMKWFGGKKEEKNNVIRL